MSGAESSTRILLYKFRFNQESNVEIFEEKAKGRIIDIVPFADEIVTALVLDLRSEVNRAMRSNGGEKRF